MFRSLLLLYISVCVSMNNHSAILYNGGLQTTTQHVFTQDWLNSDYSLSTSSCLFIWPRKQSDEDSWSRMFEPSPSRELYCVFIFACVHIACCCVLAYLPILFSFILIHDVVAVLVNKCAVVVDLAFLYRFNVKPLNIKMINKNYRNNVFVYMSSGKTKIQHQ